MSAAHLFYSFRTRLLLVLAALLVFTLSVQYYLNLLAEHNNARVMAQQEEALVTGVELGVKSMSTSDFFLMNLRKGAAQPLFDQRAGPITNILTVDNDWQIRDSLDDQYNPAPGRDGQSDRFHRLQDVKQLPPLTIIGELAGEDIQLPPGLTESPSSRLGRARAILVPVETDRGHWYVVVVFRAPNAVTGIFSREAARPLPYTLIVLLVATIVATVLVWRFTKPIQELSTAARRVAAGDFNFRVPAASRRDEIGMLATHFNEMVANLGRTRELEGRLNQAERSAVVGRLASAIAHEIRNPLNYINLTLDHLRTTYASDDPAKREKFLRLTDQLKAEVARINTRISEFLNFTRPPKPQMQALDLPAVVSDALEMVEVKASESNITTRVETHGEIPPVMGDPAWLRSVFTNLFINGLQAIDGQGGSLSVTLDADPASETARVTVTDTGRGIAPENISQIFEPYFSTKETGTGLGLAIVRKAVEGHGGTVTVKSKVDEGTTFTVTLPLAHA